MSNLYSHSLAPDRETRERQLPERLASAFASDDPLEGVYRAVAGFRDCYVADYVGPALQASELLRFFRGRGVAVKTEDLVNKDKLLGCTLHWAISAAAPSRNSVETLLVCGADPNFRDGNGKTALMKAVSQPRPDLGLIKILLNAGADMKAYDKHGNSLLMFAIDKYRFLGMEFLRLVTEFFNRGFLPGDLFFNFNTERFAGRILELSDNSKKGGVTPDYLPFLLLVEANLLAQEDSKDAIPPRDFLGGEWDKLHSQKSLAWLLITASEVKGPWAESLLSVLESFADETGEETWKEVIVGMADQPPTSTPLEKGSDSPSWNTLMRASGLVCLMLESIESNPGLVARVFGKCPFLEDVFRTLDVPGSDELVRRLASFAKDESLSVAAVGIEF